MRIQVVAFLSLFTTLVSALNGAQLLKQTQKSSVNNIIKLTKNNFERVLGGPRDSSILVLLTATNPQVGCTVCMGIQPEFEKLANSWFKDHPNGDGLFFARADFADGDSEIFVKFQLNNVPRLFLYNPTEDSEPCTSGYLPLNLPQASSDFLPYVSSVLGQMGKDVTIYEEINWSNIFITLIFAIISVYFIRKSSGAILSLLTSRPIWGGATVICIIFFITGYMFNTIRGTPYLRAAGRGGEVEYFVRGQQNQLGAETQILSFIYAILAFSVVALITKAKTISNDKVHLFVTVFILGIILVFYSVLISIFNYKSSGYPFHLLNIWSP